MKDEMRPPTTPHGFTDEVTLEQALAAPSPALVKDLRSRSGDLVILGAGGKMGPSLARLARAGLDAAGRSGDAVYAVSRFPSQELRRSLAGSGVMVLPLDLIEEDDLSALPDAAEVIHLVGAKFGAGHNQAWAWEVNTALPGRVARRYRGSRVPPRRRLPLPSGNMRSPVSEGSGCSSSRPGLGAPRSA